MGVYKGTRSRIAAGAAAGAAALAAGLTYWQGRKRTDRPKTVLNTPPRTITNMMFGKGRRNSRRTSTAVRSTGNWRAAPGKYKGKFKKVKYKKYKEFKKFARQGVVYKKETGSIAEANSKESIYVGHAVGYEAFLTTFCMALVKYLAKKCLSYDIVNFKDTVRKSIMMSGTALDRVYVYYKMQKTINDETIYPYDLSFGVDGTWYDLAVSLKGNFRTNFVQDPLFPQAGEYKLITIGMSYYENNYGTTDWKGTVAGEQIYVDFKFHSHIVIQNRTKDADGSTSTDVINSNPIVGKRYQQRKRWLNGFEPIRSRLNGGGSFTPMYSFKDNGVIVNSSASYQPELTKKPPPAYMLGASKETNVLLNPGEIKSGNLKFKIPKIGFNVLIQKLFSGLQDPNVSLTNNRLEIGYAELFGFETQLNDRMDVNAKIAVSWELNQNYEMRVFGKKPSSIPYVDVA